MGIVLKKLGEMKFGQQNIQLEYNHGGEIHFEIDSIRLAMSSDEMLKFAELIRNCKEYLLTTKKIQE